MKFREFLNQEIRVDEIAIAQKGNLPDYGVF